MDLSAIAWTAMILVVVFLSLTFAPNWSLAILILVGKIAQWKKTAPGVLPRFSGGKIAQRKKTAPGVLPTFSGGGGRGRRCGGYWIFRSNATPPPPPPPTSNRVEDGGPVNPGNAPPPPPIPPTSDHVGDGGPVNQGNAPPPPPPPPPIPPTSDRGGDGRPVNQDNGDGGPVNQGNAPPHPLIPPTSDRGGDGGPVNQGNAPPPPPPPPIPPTSDRGGDGAPVFQGNAPLTPPTQDPGDPEDLRPDSSEDSAADASATAVDIAGKTRREPVSYSIPSSLSGMKYDVFLSFRGTDTRTTITDHLFKELVNVGTLIFKGDEELHVETAIAEAIKQSRISIVILSTDYASSKWCLMQLVQMWECSKLNGQIIIPIFYDVSPSDVRHQAGDFGAAFSLHEERADSETIKKWREVLGEIADLSGYSGKLYVGYENQLAETVVLRVARILRDNGLAVTNKLFGIDLHVQGIMRKLGVVHSEGRQTEVRGEDVRVIGICGVPGVGKTTLAKVIYNEVHTLFEAYSFLEGISVRGVRASQQLLIADLLNREPAPLESVDEGIKKIASLFRNKKVLIVLDEVDGDEQIKALAGKLTWFGSRSRIIVTTRDGQVLSAFDVGANGHETVEQHKIEPMSHDHALQLFCDHVFRQDDFKEDFGYPSIGYRSFGYLFGEDSEFASVHPSQLDFGDVSEFKDMSEDIVKAIGGVPRDIVHHASILGRRRSLDMWRITLEELRGTGSLPESDAGLSVLENSSKDEKTDDD